jgi:hypothetical protein
MRLRRGPELGMTLQQRHGVVRWWAEAVSVDTAVYRCEQGPVLNPQPGAGKRPRA